MSVTSLRGDFRKDRKAPQEDYDEAPEKEFNIEEAFADLGIKSFKTEYKRLAKMAGADDFSSSRAAYALLRSQLSMLINTLPIVEAAMHKYRSDRSAYAMVAVSNHIREVAHDLRAFGDQSELVERIRRDVVQITLQTLATDIVSGIIQERKALRAKLPPKVGRYVDEVLRGYQERLDAAFADADAKAAESLPRALAAR